MLYGITKNLREYGVVRSRKPTMTLKECLFSKNCLAQNFFLYFIAFLSFKNSMWFSHGLEVSFPPHFES